MDHPTTMMLNQNIFLAIEHYLANPTPNAINRIKNLSHSLTDTAFENAKSALAPNARIGADEYHPRLKLMIDEQAESAFPLSMRLIKNEATVNEQDPAFIFKLSALQFDKIRQLKAQMLDSNMHPDGLIFAIDGYIERLEQESSSNEDEEYNEQPQEHSKYSYCEGIEAKIYDHNALLQQKSLDLANRKYDNAADILKATCIEIKLQCGLNTNFNDDTSTLKQIRVALNTASENEILRTHRGSKELIVNFLCMVSVFGLFYLASTAHTRGSFWYHPNTDTQNKLRAFSNELPNSGPSH
jgi:hypothetical protein